MSKIYVGITMHYKKLLYTPVFIVLMLSLSFAYTITAEFEPSAINVYTYDIQDNSGQNFIPILYNKGLGGYSPASVVNAPYVAPYSVGVFPEYYDGGLLAYLSQSVLTSNLGAPYATFYNYTDNFSITMWVQLNATYTSKSELLMYAHNLNLGKNCFKVYRESSGFTFYSDAQNGVITYNESVGGWSFLALTYEYVNTTLGRYTLYLNNGTTNATAIDTLAPVNEFNFGAGTIYDGSIAGGASITHLFNKIVFYNDTLIGSDIDALASNLNASGNYTGLPNEWEPVAFPSGLPYHLGFGRVLSTDECNGNYLNGTIYNIRFNPCMPWYATGAPADGDLLVPSFVLRYNGTYLTPYLREEMSTDTILSGYTADHAGTCWVYTGSGVDFPIPTGEWIAEYPDNYTLYLPTSYAPPLQRSTNPVLFLGHQIYCTTPENLTAHFFINGAYGVVETDLTFDFNIGNCMSLDGVYNYSCISNQTFFLGAPTGYNATDALGNAPGQDDTTGAIALALVSPTFVMLYIAIFLSACVAYFTRQGLFAMVVLVSILLVMGAVGLLDTWFFYLIIVIAALGVGLYLLKSK